MPFCTIARLDRPSRTRTPRPFPLARSSTIRAVDRVYPTSIRRRQATTPCGRRRVAPPEHRSTFASRSRESARALPIYATPSSTTAGDSISCRSPRLLRTRNGGRSRMCVCAAHVSRWLRTSATACRAVALSVTLREARNFRPTVRSRSLCAPTVTFSPCRRGPRSRLRPSRRAAASPP